MDFDPVTVLKRKSSVKTSFDLCIFCQKSSKEQLRNASENGKEKVKDCLNRRRKLRDVSNATVLDRFESLSESEWESEKLIQWHKGCYSTFTLEQQLQRLQKKADEARVVEASTSVPTSRRSTEPVDWTKCMFCQIRKKNDDVELHSVQEMPISDGLMKKAQLIPVMRLRFSGISDLPAAEGKYHLNCLVKFERNVEKIAKSGAKSAEDLGHVRTLYNS